jgi:hypothetical protein
MKKRFGLTTPLITLLLVLALVTHSSLRASAKPLTVEQVHDRIVRRGLGNWIGVVMSNGTAFTGRIVSINSNSFALQLHNDPTTATVLYSDVIKLRTGLRTESFWAVTIVGVAAIATVVAIGIHEADNNKPIHESAAVQPVPQNDAFASLFR